MGIKTFERVVAELKNKPILVANRGIPARRICRSIRERFDAVAIMTATDVDKASPAASAAQELMLLGADPRAYLDIERVVSLAKRRGVAGIHPGWGFASEDDTFPRLCAEAGLVFIGSTAEAMNLLGNKVQVRALAKKLGIPVVPGSDGAVDVPTAKKVAKEIGFPIMLKAEGGGGGRGIFEVHNEEALDDAFFKASSMAQASFGNPRVYVERFLRHVRHIEIQVIADKYGNVFAFDERDCSMQRNNQKLIEITPSPWSGLSEQLRESLKEYSRTLVKSVGYHSLCTVEFLVTEEGTPYLIEVNTRLQVEHGITECRYGIDLVEEQIAVAFGSRLRFTEDNMHPAHTALQVRINCENPQANFAPNSGLITRYVSPGGPGVRLDSNMSAGYEFPSNYDSAGSLLITYGQDWPKVLGIMERALSEYIIGGLKTTIPFFRQILKHPAFRLGQFDTRFIAATPDLMSYMDLAPEAERTARLIGEISARGWNPFVQLGEYRSIDTPRVPQFELSLPKIGASTKRLPSPYPRGDRRALLDFVRDSSYVHFCDTICRDNTQSNSGNRFRLAEDLIVAPYLDNCGFFSLETGGGAHFHVNMMANMTSPFFEDRELNRVAPKTMKQILIRSTNVLGYKPQPKNLMQRMAEKICEEYHVIRCFDFLNHVENMKPFADVILNTNGVVFEPAISLTPAPHFTAEHYVDVAAQILRQSAKIMGVTPTEATRLIILGLKDMAGNCSPTFMRNLVTALRKRWPDLVLHYHRHCTDGLFVPAVTEAALAGTHIVDTSIGSATRWYGQGDLLSTAAYMEERGLSVKLNRQAVRDSNFVLKQIIPYYDRYTAPFFQGTDYDVVNHGMPGGATSSSQEGALKQGYIHLLPHMLRYLSGTRRIVYYHDVTPGSQITWNTAFLAITCAYKRGGESEVDYLLEVMETVARTPEAELSPEMKEARLALYQDCNDAFRDLLLGKFGKLPLGFPPEWVYQSAFGNDWKKALSKRTEKSPLEFLAPVDFEAERAALRERIHREPTEDEFLLYLNHPVDAVKTIEFQQKFGNPNSLPLAVWFEGLQPGEELWFNDSLGKPHHFSLLRVQKPGDSGVSVVRYSLDSEIMSAEVQVAAPKAMGGRGGVPMADPNNECHVAAPSTGDLWVMYVAPGDMVKKGEEIFNISIMKQEKAVLAPCDGVVKRVLKTADFKENKQMVPVKEGELIVELGPVASCCANDKCGKPLPSEGYSFCPHCGKKAKH